MNAKNPIPIAVATGDGIGPEIAAAALHILREAGASLEIHPIEIRENKGARDFDPASWEIIRQAKAFLKGPTTTPQGGGHKSLNVRIRTALGLYANVRPCLAYHPFVETRFPGMDVVIIRENEEDLYLGIEYRQTADTYQALKVMTTQGCERIIRYAFEYAQAHQRKKVSCMTKDNILKMTDGLFHQTFERIAKEYPHVANEHWIIDIGAAKLADSPTLFDVIVLPNLYGDILSDIAAQLTGSVGLAGSANIGTTGAMFEAVHGSAAALAGKNLANPSGLLLAAVQMLEYLDQPATATLVHNAWLKTLEEGIHTQDIFKEGKSRQLVGTKEFAEAVIACLGKTPDFLPSVHYSHAAPSPFSYPQRESHCHKELVGVDLFIQWETSAKGETIAKLLQTLAPPHLQLTLITNRGATVWPQQLPETRCSDNWRCRLLKADAHSPLSLQQIIALLQAVTERGIDVTQVQPLFLFDGTPGFT